MTSEAGMAELIRDRYEPLEVVGGGGQGQVLRAVDRWHARQVALKVRAAGCPDQRAALLAEARILLGLEPHPGLPLVREDFFVGDRYYLVMDWVDGTSLQRVLDERGDPGLPFPTVLGWLDQVAAALDHLHRHEPPIVHQDVKPANLVLDARRRVVLVDFGISAPAGHAPPTPVGSAGYTAPEVAAGGPATPAADVYSLGATAFALLTGAPPRGGPLRWHGLRQAEAGAAERAIRRALSTDPAQRPGSAGELLERLRAWLEPSLPSGTVTFLLTDVDQAGRLWEQHPAAMQQALARHDAVLADTVERHRGALVGARVEDDSVLAVFARATDALACALALGRASGPWPGGGGSPLRMALHSGEAEPRHGRYPGGTATRCAALRALAGGGEILLSQATHDLVVDALPSGARLDDLGSRRLEGLGRPERVFRLEHPQLPPPAGGPRTEPLPRLAGPAPAADRPRSPARPRRRRHRLAGGLLVSALAALALVAALSLPLTADREPAAESQPVGDRAPVGDRGAAGESQPAGDLPLPPRRVDPATITVSASSELAADHDAGLTYAAGNTIDGELTTAWNDGVGGVGVGETLTYTFAHPVRLVRVDAVNGYAKSPRRYAENARIRQATLSTDAASFPVTFADRYRLWQSFSLDSAPTSSVTLEIESVYAGSAYRDVALTEVAFWAQPP